MRIALSVAGGTIGLLIIAGLIFYFIGRTLPEKHIAKFSTTLPIAPEAVWAEERRKGSCFTFYLFSSQADMLAQVEARAHVELGRQPAIARLGGRFHLQGQSYLPCG